MAPPLDNTFESSRIDHACQLLGQTNLPLSEISSTCRFADQSHFTKQFRKLSVTDLRLRTGIW